MNITEYSKQLRELTMEHVNCQISLDAYRKQRKYLLDALDRNFNGVEAHQIKEEQAPAEVTDGRDQRDKTQPYLAAKIDKCMSFLTGSNDN
ncbi:MAG: hypothetical protein ACJAT7_001939 [Psychromonas sp.]|jgi:hypothetical protein|uniref:hypothetical protein n=1 Tax=Psychromonas sp. TaxID=1884585 RepID=UPI0039E4E718